MSDDAQSSPIDPQTDGADRRRRSILEPGVNCWRIARAARASVVVDAADYYHFIREAMEAAQQRILLIGWDFDSRIALEPDATAKKYPETLGQFFLRLAHDNPRREIRILKWSFGALKQFLRPSSALNLARWARTRAITFKFDSMHPAGCSHHQKIVVIDNGFAVCGGIDISTARWDTSEHRDDDPRRTLPNGKAYMPWHDVTMLVDAGAAEALAELGEDRWAVASGKPLSPLTASTDHWPQDVDVMFHDVDIAIARTRAPYESVAEVREIEALFLAMIDAAEKFIYIENQYLTSGKIAAALAARFEQGRPIDIVIVMPRQADGWLEQRAMDAARVQLARAVGKVDANNRFRVYVPVTKGGNDIYVHAKVMIVDDTILRIGSANLNNRSLGLDSECDLIIDSALPANADAGPAITAIRARLLAEHLGVDEEAVIARMRDTGSLVDTVESLRGSGRTLELLDLEKPGPLDAFIADNELLDPHHADGFLEPLERRGLRKSWRRGKRWIALRRKRRRAS